MKPPPRLRWLSCAICLAITSCRESPPQAVLVAEGIEGEQICVVLKDQTLRKPIRAIVDRGVVRFYVNKDPPRPTASVVTCRTNASQGTITICVDYHSSGETGKFQVFLDDKSLGRWTITK